MCKLVVSYFYGGLFFVHIGEGKRLVLKSSKKVQVGAGAYYGYLCIDNILIAVTQMYPNIPGKI